MSDTVICIASGPSLTQEDVDYCRGKGRVFVVNDNYLKAPWADVLYAADGPASSADWWAHHLEKIKQIFTGACWTVDFSAAKNYGLNHIAMTNDVWSNVPGVIATGGNSGFQAINLAAVHPDHPPPARIILLGYDMGVAADGRKHWFGDHPGGLNRTSNYEKWRDNFRKAVPHMRIPVINCSRETALDCFPREKLEDVL